MNSVTRRWIHSVSLVLTMNSAIQMATRAHPGHALNSSRCHHNPNSAPQYVQAFSWGPVGWVFVSEIFALDGRGMAVGVATSTLWLVNTILAVHGALRSLEANLP